MGCFAAHYTVVFAAFWRKYANQVVLDSPEPASSRFRVRDGRDGTDDGTDGTGRDGTDGTEPLLLRP